MRVTVIVTGAVLTGVPGVSPTCAIALGAAAAHKIAPNKKSNQLLGI